MEEVLTLLTQTQNTSLPAKKEMLKQDMTTLPACRSLKGGGRVQDITTAGLEDDCRLIRLQKNILDGVLISTH